MLRKERWAVAAHILLGGVSHSIKLEDFSSPYYPVLSTEVLNHGYNSCHHLRFTCLWTSNPLSPEFGGLTLFFLSWYMPGLWWGYTTSHLGRQKEQRCCCGSWFGSRQISGMWIPSAQASTDLARPSFQFRITIGYHRLYSHKSFRATIGVRIVLAILGSSAFQGSIKVSSISWVPAVFSYSYHSYNS